MHEMQNRLNISDRRFECFTHFLPTRFFATAHRRKTMYKRLKRVSSGNSTRKKRGADQLPLLTVVWTGSSSSAATAFSGGRCSAECRLISRKKTRTSSLPTRGLPATSTNTRACAHPPGSFSS